MVSRPGPHPPPPGDFAQRNLLIRSLEGRLFRIHRKEYGPIFYGCTGSNRFDDPLHEFGVLYAGRDEYGAFIETHGQRTGSNAVSELELRGRCLAVITPERQLRLADFTGRGLATMGADNRLAAADHDLAQLWSRAVWSIQRGWTGFSFVRVMILAGFAWRSSPGTPIGRRRAWEA